jgi:Ca2+:H+ antiporter
VFLFLSYVIGLWFTLRTHAAVIWATDADEKKLTQNTLESSTTSNEIRQLRQTYPSLVPGGDLNGQRLRDSALYKRILGQSLRQVGLSDNLDSGWEQIDSGNLPSGATPHVVPPRQNGSNGPSGLKLSGLSEEENEYLARQVAEVAATAATVAARDAARSQRKPVPTLSTSRSDRRPSSARRGTVVDDHDDSVPPFEPSHSSGGHDAPNWSKTKSSIILLGATFLYAVIAEILVNTVDIVLESVNIDEKFLGITLFALVPNTTEFLVRGS